MSSKMLEPRFADASAWKARLLTALEDAVQRPLVFVLGAGVARDAGGGIWSVRDILKELEKPEYGLVPRFY